MNKQNHNLKSDYLIPVEWQEPRIHRLYGVVLLNNLVPSPITNSSAAMMSLLDLVNLIRGADLRLGAYEGIQFGADITPAAHGLMGQAAISAPDLGESVDAMRRFTAIRHRLLDISLQRQKTSAVLTLKAAFPLGEIEDFVLAATASTFMGILAFLLNQEDHQELQLQLPNQYQEITQWPPIMADIPLHFTQANEVKLTIPTPLLHKPNLTADNIQYRLACLGCEQELSIVQGQISARVKAVISDGQQNGWLSMNEVAQALHMSPRTLTRKLRDEQTCYGDILASVKTGLACWYLREGDLPVAQIAESLGYRDVSNFSRTFRRWMGHSPSHHRSTQREGDD